MMRWIVGSSLKFSLLVVVIAAALMVAGIQQLREASVDVLPEYGPPYVEIQTEALGLSAAEVEQLITVPMEQLLLNGVAWLDEIRSESVAGLSSIVLIFEPGTDPLRARQVVQERLTQARDLPRVSKPPVMIQPLSSTSRAMMIRLSSAELTPIEVSVLARWTIRPRLMGVPGVANVAIWGQRERQLQVLVDPERMRANGVTLDQVIESTGNALWVSPLSFLEASTPGSGGFIDTPNQRLGIQHLLPIKTAQELALVPIEGCTGGLPTARRHVDANCPPPPVARPLTRLGDVAMVVEDHQPLIGDAVASDGQGLLLVIEKFPEANVLEVTEDVEAALDEMRPGLRGLEMDTTIYRPASFIETSMDNLLSAMLIGLLLVALVLALFLRDWRAALVGAVAIPVSLLAAGLVLHWRGATFNTMLLAGLVVALGAVVDDAVVQVENITRRLRQQRQAGGGKPSAAVVLDAAVETRGAITFATLIILLAALPVYFAAYAWGLSGAFFRPIALSYVLALLASALVALTVTPALALLALSRGPLEQRESWLVRRLRRAYDRPLAWCTRRPLWIVAPVAVVALAGLAVLPFLERAESMVPSFEERDLLIYWEGAPGTSHPEMVRITTRVSDELHTIPGVRNVGAHVGRAVTSDQVVGINAGELWVNIDPDADYDATVAAIEEVVDGYPGLYHEVLTYLDERTQEAGAVADEIVVRVYGQDLDVLRAKAEEVRQILARTDGLSDEHVQLRVEEPQVEILVDLAEAEAHGLKPGDVRRAAAALVSGVEVGSLFEQQKVFEVVVWSTPETRHSLTSIRELPIDTPSGEFVRLGDLAEVRFTPSPMSIKHDAVSRYIDVSANVRGRNVDAVARDVEERLAEVQFPLEHHAEVLGELQERQANERRLLGFALAAVLGIFLLLQAAFGSWRLATLVFLSLPLAMAGGLLAAYLAGDMISLGALIGFLTVLGIAARNSCVLIDRFQRLARDEGLAIGPELIQRGARERLAPVLMTALATGLALVPLLLIGNGPGYEIAHPIAVITAGGLVTATLVTLFVVPALYGRLAPGSQRQTAGSHVSPGPNISPAPVTDD